MPMLGHSTEMAVHIEAIDPSRREPLHRDPHELTVSALVVRGPIRVIHIGVTAVAEEQLGNKLIT